MSREILQRANQAVTKAADIATHPFDTPTQRTLREWQKQENSLSAKQPNGDTLSVVPGSLCDTRGAAILGAVTGSIVTLFSVGIAAHFLGTERTEKSNNQEKK